MVFISIPLWFATVFAGLVSAAPQQASTTVCPPVEVPDVWYLGTPVELIIPPSNDPNCVIDAITLFEPGKNPAVLYSNTNSTNPAVVTVSLPPGCVTEATHMVTITYVGAKSEQKQLIGVKSRGQNGNNSTTVVPGQP